MKVGRFGLGFKSVFHLTGRRITIKPCEKPGTENILRSQEDYWGYVTSI